MQEKSLLILKPYLKGCVDYVPTTLEVRRCRRRCRLPAGPAGRRLQLHERPRAHAPRRVPAGARADSSLALLRTRLELFSVELKEEKLRAGGFPLRPVLAALHRLRRGVPAHLPHRTCSGTAASWRWAQPTAPHAAGRRRVGRHPGARPRPARRLGTSCRQPGQSPGPRNPSRPKQ